jgi:hypothetical protein
MTKVPCLAVEKPRQYRLIASLIQEALLHLVYEFVRANPVDETDPLGHDFALLS